MHNPVVWLTAANVLYLISYSVRDILWLRVLSVVAGTLLIPYYAMQPTPLMDAIRWNVLFISINGYWIVRLMLERRPVQLTPDEARLRTLSFPSLTTREAKNLFSTGAWEDIAVGKSIVQHDNGSGRFSVILRGLADVTHHGTKIADFGEGQFVGVIDEHAVQIDLDVVVRESAHVMCWSQSKLHSFVATRPDVELALERSTGLEVGHLLDSALSEIGKTPS